MHLIPYFWLHWFKLVIIWLVGISKWRMRIRWHARWVRSACVFTDASHSQRYYTLGKIGKHPTCVWLASLRPQIFPTDGASEWFASSVCLLSRGRFELTFDCHDEQISPLHSMQKAKEIEPQYHFPSFHTKWRKVKTENLPM